MLFEDAHTAFRSVLLVTAMGQCVVGAQTLANRRLFEPGGILGWRALQRGDAPSRAGADGQPAASFDVILVTGLAGLQCVSGAGAVVAALVDASPIVPLVGLVASSAALAARFPFLVFGAERMGNVVSVVMLLAAVVQSPGAMVACLVFIAFQTSLAYLAAGVGKAFHRSWRDGSCLRDLFATEVYGDARVAAWMRRFTWLPGILGRAIVASEVLFPLLLVVPPEIAGACLSIGVLFHLAIASVMGLNVFLWMFPATYPAVMFANSLIRGQWLAW